MVQMGAKHIDRTRFDADEVARNDFFVPDATVVDEWADYLHHIRTVAHSSVGAVIEVIATGVPPGPWRASLCQTRYRPCRRDDVDQRGKGG